MSETAPLPFPQVPPRPELPRPSIIPMFDRVLILPDPVITQVGGVLLPNQSQSQRSTGRVVTVGEGRLCPTSVGNWGALDRQGTQNPVCHVEPLRVRVGDHVFYNNYSGVGIQDDPEVEGEKPKNYLLIQEDDILCILDRTVPADPTDPVACPGCGQTDCVCGQEQPHVDTEGESITS